MRIIDADVYAAELWKLRQNYQMLDDTHTADMIMHGIFSAEQALKEQPTVDAVPVVHGEWICHEMVSTFDGMMSGYSCSECCTFVSEEMFDSDEFPKDICGFCGAKMNGGNRNADA